ncbi:MAG: hypothetical protein IJW98_00070 [Clostridia bacterium]|nr:hypothetical protein [Clostridia bacterium]
MLMSEKPDLPWIESETDLREAFAICYPDIRWEDVPDGVKAAATEQGIPVAAVYGDYLARREDIRKTADAALIRAMEQSPGLPRGAVGERLYSIEEMRAMPPKEVRSRYGSLLASLRRGFEKW